VKALLHEIWLSETKNQANSAMDDCISRYEAKYPKATKCLEKDREALLTFYASVSGSGCSIIFHSRLKPSREGRDATKSVN